MPKRRGIKTRPNVTTISTADENAMNVIDASVNDNEDAIPLGGFGGDGNDADSSINPLESKLSLWDEVQHSLSDHLLPLISRPEQLLTTELLSSNTIDRQGNVNADAESNIREVVRMQPTRQQLLIASQQLFRYIEYLASMEVKLNELQKQNNTTKTDADGGGQEVVSEEVTNVAEEEEIEEEPCSLSGLSSLYTGNQINTISYDAMSAVDAETIWGQVDLQNQVLISRLKKMIKKLSKRSTSTTNPGNDDHDEKVIRLLYTGSMMDSDEDGEDDEEAMSIGIAVSDYELKEKDEEENDSDADSDEGIALVNQDRRRIRDRMEKAMADMSDDDEDFVDDNDDDNIIELTSKSSAYKVQAMNDFDTDTNGNHEGIVDPTREDLRDGFFDLHEMEAFADEEEEMLPDDAYGEEDPDDALETKKGKAKKKSVLPHVRDRLGIDSEDDDDDDFENEDKGFEDGDIDDPLSKRFQPTGVRRKKYRADDEVEALYKIYEGVDNDDENDSEIEKVVDASTMTAADFFGQPNKSLIQKYKAKTEKEAKIKGKQNAISHKKNVRFSAKAKISIDDDDNDSWDNHNFEEEGLDWKDNGEGIEVNAESDEDQIEGGEEDAGANDNFINEPKLSSHAKQLQKLKEQTISIEQDMMSEKPWKMMGEAKGTDRATDSLLESTPEFEVAFKPPPILTPEHAANIEEMIKKRIIDEDWDDVVPRELPDIGGHKRGGDAPEVSQEKSKLGLGELYEREYLKKTAGFDRDAHEKQTEEDAAKEEMKQLFANLCSQLDALSNYHFAPRPVADMADVRNREDIPAIAMEEVLPLHVSQSRGVAPEEVFAAGKGRKSVLKGESELDQGERKSVRNAKKAARRKARKQKHADEKLISKLQPGLGLNNPYEKRKLREELQMARASGKVVVASDNKGEWKDDAAAGKEYQTSAKFFAKMQENVEAMLRDDGNGEGTAKKKRRKGLEAGQASSVYRL